MVARAVQDKYVREWWDKQILRITKSIKGTEEGEDRERMRAQKMKTVLDSLCT